MDILQQLMRDLFIAREMEDTKAVKRLKGEVKSEVDKAFHRNFPDCKK